MYKINIEIPLILSAFGALLTSLVQSNYLIYRTCYADLGYNESECALLGNSNSNATRHLETLVEPEVTVMNTVKSVVDSSVTIIACLFVGSWSEKFGRKPIMVFCYAGGIVSSTLLLLTDFFPNLSGWFITFYSLPSLIAGGGPAIMTIIMSYVADTTSPEYTPIRFTVIDVSFSVANMVGTISSSYLFKAIGYSGVFTVNIVCSVISCLYTYFMIPESLQTKKVPEQNKDKIKDVFNLENIKEIFRVTFKKRDHLKREIVSLLILFSIIFTLVYGEFGLTFLFLRAKFGWTMQKYSLYSSACSGLSVVGVSLTIFILYRKLHLKESILMLIGLSSSFAGNLLCGFASSDTYIYTAGAIRCIGGIVNPMTKSIMAKTISVDEVTKVFSVMMMFNFLFGLVSTPMFNMLYKSTLDTNPAIYNFVGAAFFGINICITIIIIVLEIAMNRRIHYENSATPKKCESGIPKKSDSGIPMKCDSDIPKKSDSGISKKCLFT